MRMLAVVEYFPPVLGHDLRIFELARRLPADFDVRFIVLPRLRALLEPQGLEDQVQTHDSRVVPIPLELPKWLRGAWRETTALPFLLTLAVLVLGALRGGKRWRPDVVVANYPSPYTGLLAYALARLWDVPFVVDFCDDIVAYFEGLFPSRARSYMTQASRKVQDFLIRASVVLPVVTRGLYDYAASRRVSPNRIVILPNGVDIELFERSSGSRMPDAPNHLASFRCFYGGSLDAWSGTALLMDLARRGQAPPDAIELYVAGQPFPEVNSTAPPNFHHLGLLGKKELAEVLGQCDCVVVPLSAGDAADAASPVKLFEGLAAGKPCICSRTRGISEVITDGENGLLVDSLDADAWLARIHSLQANPALLKRLSENARATAARYDWTALAESFASLLRRAREARAPA